MSLKQTTPPAAGIYHVVAEGKIEQVAVAECYSLANRSFRPASLRYSVKLNRGAADNMKPDKTENGIRFGCGFTFGLVLGFAFAVQWIAATWGGFAAIAIASAIVCGLLAMKYGDAFWHFLKDKYWWWW